MAYPADMPTPTTSRAGEDTMHLTAPSPKPENSNSILPDAKFHSCSLPSWLPITILLRYVSGWAMQVGVNPSGRLIAICKSKQRCRLHLFISACRLHAPHVHDCTLCCEYAVSIGTDWTCSTSGKLPWAMCLLLVLIALLTTHDIGRFRHCIQIRDLYVLSGQLHCWLFVRVDPQVHLHSCE